MHGTPISMQGQENFADDDILLPRQIPVHARVTQRCQNAGSFSDLIEN